MFWEVAVFCIYLKETHGSVSNIRALNSILYLHILGVFGLQSVN